LIAKPELMEKVRIESFQTEQVGIYTLRISARSCANRAAIREKIHRAAVAGGRQGNLRPDPWMILEGTVTMSPISAPRRRGSASGRTGARQRAIGALHQGSERSCEAGQMFGQSAVRGFEGQAHRTVHQALEVADAPKQKHVKSRNHQSRGAGSTGAIGEPVSNAVDWTCLWIRSLEARARLLKV